MNAKNIIEFINDYQNGNETALDLLKRQAMAEFVKYAIPKIIPRPFITLIRNNIADRRRHIRRKGV